MVTLARQIALVEAEVRISERQIEKSQPDTDPHRAATMRRDILKGKLDELIAGLRQLEGVS